MIYSHDVNPPIIDLDVENDHESMFKSPSKSMFGQNSDQSSESSFLYDENESFSSYFSSSKSKSLDTFSSADTKASSSTSNQKYLKIDRNFENEPNFSNNFTNHPQIKILSNDEESLASYFSSIGHMSSSSVDEEISPPLNKVTIATITIGSVVGSIVLLLIIKRILSCL